MDYIKPLESLPSIGEVITLHDNNGESIKVEVVGLVHKAKIVEVKCEVIFDKMLVQFPMYVFARYNKR